MHTFKINKDNIIYKNYIIRFYEKSFSSNKPIQKHFRLISYNQALPDLHNHISREISTYQYLIDGNWTPNRNTSCGLLPHPFKIDYVNKKDGLIKAKKIIDEISKHEKIESSYYWFFISLAHMSDIIDEGYINTCISKNSLKRSINYLYVKKIKIILHKNKLSLEKCLKEGGKLEFFHPCKEMENRYELTQEDVLKVDKIKMLSPFFNKMLDMENAVDAYMKESS